MKNNTTTQQIDNIINFVKWNVKVEKEILNNSKLTDKEKEIELALNGLA